MYCFTSTIYSTAAVLTHYVLGYIKFLIKSINLHIRSYVYIKGVVHLYCYLYIVGLCATLMLFVFGNSCSMDISNLPVSMSEVRQQTPG